jgi:hypothetical protein
LRVQQLLREQRVAAAVRPGDEARSHIVGEQREIRAERGDWAAPAAGIFFPTSLLPAKGASVGWPPKARRVAAPVDPGSAIGGSVISTVPPGPELILKLDVVYWPAKLICATVTLTSGWPKRPLVTVSTPLFDPVDV